MRNPLRKAGYSALALLVGSLLVRFGSARFETVGEDMLAIVTTGTGVTLGTFGLVYLVTALFHARGRAKLLAGRGVIARWHVSAQDWERFRDYDGRRGASDTHFLLSELWIRKQTPAEGIDIIVGEKSLLVDNSYHVLRPRGLPELRSIEWLAEAGAPECLEFRLVYPRGRYGGVQHISLRIPIPFHARVQARQVHAWFEPRTRREPGLALRNPKRTQRVCLALFLIATVAGATGYAIARATDFHFASPNEAILPLVLIIGGLGVAVFAAILSLATIGLTGRAKR